MFRCPPCSFFLVLVAGFAIPAAAQSRPAQPTEEHKVLSIDAGVWDAKMKVYVNGPDAAPIEATAVETNSMLGEFWLVSKLEYEMFGQKVQGRGQFGYDPASRKFIGTWCDSSSPYLSTLEGTWNEAEKTFTYVMNGRDEAGNPTSGKLITKIHSNTRKTFEMHMEIPGGAGQFMKMMDVEYTRRQ